MVTTTCHTRTVRIGLLFMRSISLVFFASNKLPDCSCPGPFQSIACRDATMHASRLSAPEFCNQFIEVFEARIMDDQLAGALPAGLDLDGRTDFSRSFLIEPRDIAIDFLPAPGCFAALQEVLGKRLGFTHRQPARRGTVRG